MTDTVTEYGWSKTGPPGHGCPTEQCAIRDAAEYGGEVWERTVTYGEWRPKSAGTDTREPASAPGVAAVEYGYGPAKDGARPVGVYLWDGVDRRSRYVPTVVQCGSRAEARSRARALFGDRIWQRTVTIDAVLGTPTFGDWQITDE
jgi:hypothetical protein